MVDEMHDVVVVGSGPTGMVLAAELALAGVDVVVLERRRTAELVGSRGGGFHARTLEVLDQRGVVDRFLTQGQTVQVLSFAGTPLDLSAFPTRHPYTLGLWQNHIERILLGWVEELGVTVRRGTEVTGFDQDEHGVDVHLGAGTPVRASYVVAADGGRSAIRKAAGIAFVGAQATRSSLVAEVEVAEEIPSGPLHDEAGVHGLHLMEDGRTVRVVTTEREIGPQTEATLGELGASLTAAFGTDFGVHSPTWISRFTDATRQAATYRDRRVLLAGDAAHVHYPAGGQGIGLGVQDAVNLGWKLAQVVHGISPDTLLNTYEAERHPVTARVLEHTMALTATQGSGPRTAALAGVFDSLLAFDGPRTMLAGLLSGLTTSYGESGAHALQGRRVPDLDLVVDDAPVRVHELLHRARPVLLQLGGVPLDATGWEERVQHVTASYDGPWELPVIGVVDAPTAVLVRPDGHVAWVGDGTDTGLREALTTWFGPGSIDDGAHG